MLRRCCLGGAYGCSGTPRWICAASRPSRPRERSTCATRCGDRTGPWQGRPGRRPASLWPGKLSPPLASCSGVRSVCIVAGGPAHTARGHSDHNGSPDLARATSREVVGMDDSEGTRALRRDLGRALKEARRAAGYSQAQLARKTGYARSTVSTVESGSQNVPRIFWERSDAALGSGTVLLARYDRLAQRRIAGLSRTAAGAWAREDTRHARRGLGADIVSDAIAAYMRLGWRVHDGDGRIDLVCGNGIEALEVPRPTGVVAVHWWLHTGGAPDEIRRLPTLPGPQDALTVVAAGDRFLFLVQPGACPWTGPDL